MMMTLQTARKGQKTLTRISLMPHVMGWTPTTEPLPTDSTYPRFGITPRKIGCNFGYIKLNFIDITNQE
jgi:hypothetical protein